MKKVFLITDDPALRQAVSQCAQAQGAQVHATTQWSEARERLFKKRYDAVFIDYKVMKLEGLDAFILLDNVLQKEHTKAWLILRKPSHRAQQFIDSLGSFGPPIELHGQAPSAETLQAPLEACLRQAAAADSQQDVDESAVGPILVDVHLKTDLSGTLAEVSLVRALYTLAFTGPSGVLVLKHGELERRYAIYQGRPRKIHRPEFSELSTLSSAFAWDKGKYRFDAETLPEGPTEEPFGFIYQAIARHMPPRHIMQQMMPHMRTYPVHTDLWQARAEELGGLALLERLMKACDGQTTLEQALGSLGADATKGFQAALFATKTDLLSLQSDPTFRTVSIQYNREITRLRQQRVEVQSKDSKAYRAKGSGRANLEAELSKFLQHLEHATPYEIFDVWEGCGRKIIRNKFYAMVKQHHPDVYGGNISGDVKRLVQEIFITIKDTYQELEKIEHEQRCPRPAPAPDNQSGDLGDQRSFGAEAAPPSPHTSRPKPSPAQTPPGAERPDGGQQTNKVRQSRIERLKVKRNATPIGLGREPSVPLQTNPPRKRRKSTGDRRAKLDRIRKNSSSGKATTGAHKPADTAANAFNSGYTAWRENDNIDLAARHFSTAYNLEPNSGKYMTFYGYFLFLKDASNLDDALRILEKAIGLKDRQSLPDAHVFMGNLLTFKQNDNAALRHYKIALRLNPASRDAQRAIRLHEKRSNKPQQSEGVAFLKNLFKK